MGRSLTLVLLLGSMSLASVVPAQVTGDDALLGRWRDIQELAHAGQMPTEQWREAAMVMALAQFYHASVLGHLSLARNNAVSYLQTMSQRHASRVAGHLREAASRHDQVLRPAADADVGERALGAVEGRGTLAGVVERMASYEAAAADAMTEALNTM